MAYTMLLGCSITGAIGCLLFWLLQSFFDRTLTKTVQKGLLLWIAFLFIVPLNTLIPNLSQLHSLYWNPTAWRQFTETPLEEGTEKGQEAFHYIEDALSAASQGTQPGMAVEERPAALAVNQLLNSRQDIMEGLFLAAWGFTAVVLLARKGKAYRQFQKSCIALSRPASIAKDEKALQALQTERQLTKSNESIQLRFWKQGGIPMTTGIRNSCVYLPDQPYEGNALSLILRHECLHIKHRDIVINCFLEGISALYFFHPAVYWLKKTMRSCCEYAVDEQIGARLEKEEKKQYCQAILETAGNRELPFSTALGGGKMDMKKRFTWILCTKKTKLHTVVLAVILALVMGSFSVYGATELIGGRKGESFVIAVETDGLYQIGLNGEAKRLVSSLFVKQPVISPKGGYAAYLDQGKLCIISLKNGWQLTLAQGGLSYAWADENTLVYSFEDGGLYQYSLSDKRIQRLGDQNAIYRDITCGKGQQAYARRETFETRSDGTYVTSLGIYSIDRKSGQESVLIPGRLSSEEGYELGYGPEIAGISKDQTVLYIWDRTMSGSTSTDGIRLAYYMLKDGEFMQHTYDELMAFEEDTVLLRNKGNISSNPADPMVVAINSGSGREMYYNKRAGVLNLANRQFLPFTGEEKTTMTVSFSKDGTGVYFSMADAINLLSLADSPTDEGYAYHVKRWYEEMPHNIYYADGRTKEMKKLTDGGFDFQPMPIDQNTFLFIRRENETAYSLYKMEKGREIKLADNLNFYGSGMQGDFYGAFYCEEVLDYYTP